jgi:exodeoxyribonuclease-3
MKLVSWNVNGLRACLKKGLSDFIRAADADVICLQETKCQPDDVPDISWCPGYHPIWNSADKKGYSGTLILTRQQPISVQHGMQKAEHDSEGRVIAAEFPDFWLVNVYQPNSQRGLTRLEYRTESWDPAFRKFLHRLEKQKPVLFCGDLNVAHQEIDLANPKSNRRNAGFTDEERGRFTELLDSGFIDTFRQFEKGGGHYTWWSLQPGCRARNIGWRVDYWIASQKLLGKLKRSWIEPAVMGSDHCPVFLEIER